MSAGSRGPTEQGAVAGVIQRALIVNDGNENFPAWDVYFPEGVALVIRQALADAGLLLSDADRAVLDAADQWEAAFNAWAGVSLPDAYDVIREQLAAAVRARREAQS